MEHSYSIKCSNPSALIENFIIRKLTFTKGIDLNNNSIFNMLNNSSLQDNKTMEF